MDNTKTQSGTTDMRVTKRDGNLEEVAFDKILSRVKKLGQEVGIQINYQQLVIKIIDQLFDTIYNVKSSFRNANLCVWNLQMFFYNQPTLRYRPQLFSTYN